MCLDHSHLNWFDIIELILIPTIFNSFLFLAFILFFFFPLPLGSDGKEFACSVEDPGLIPRLGRSPGEESGNPLQYSCLENSMDRGAWRATVHEVAKSQTRLSHSTLFLPALFFTEHFI